MTNTSTFYWNWSSKTQIFTDIWTLSVGGCWGELMLLFWKLVDETKIYEPPEATKHHNSLKLSILLSVRANLLCTLQCETPCILCLLIKNSKFKLKQHWIMAFLRFWFWLFVPSCTTVKEVFSWSFTKFDWVGVSKMI